MLAPTSTGSGVSLSRKLSDPQRRMQSRVTSSRLCKYAEGAGFPFQIESLENGVDDAVQGLHVDEADHGPGSSANFHKAALDDVGGTQFSPQVFGEAEEGQQFGQV